MLTSEEIKKVGQLLVAPNKESFQLGLSMAEHNLEYLEQWLPLLYALFQTTYPAQEKELEQWFLKYVKKPRREYWNRKTIFLKWTSISKKELVHQKKKSEELYERAKQDFIGDLEVYEQVLAHSYQSEKLYSRLSTYFYYEENEYILATHFAVVLYQREQNIDAMWCLSPVLMYYHFPNKNLLFLEKEVIVWIHQFIEKEGVSYNSLYFKWVEAVIQKSLGNKQQAIQLLEKTLDWIEQAPHLIRQAKELVALVYLYLGLLYAQTEQVKLAKRMYKIGRPISTRDIYAELRAEIYCQLGQYPKAIKILKQSIKRRPIAEMYWVRLAKVYLELKQLDKAIDAYMSCIDYSPQYKLHIQTLIQLLQKSKRVDKQFLIEHYQQVIADIDTSVEEIAELLL